MKLSPDYGRTGLTIELPDDLPVSVVQPAKGVPLADATAAVEHALAAPHATRPLLELARGRRTATVVIPDKTRPVPNGVVLPPILRTLEAAGMRRADIEILVATGLHRPNTHDELVEMINAEVVAQYRVRNHVARNAAEHVYLGRTRRGTEVWLD